MLYASPQFRSTMRIRLCSAGDAARLVSYYSKNREHLSPWEPDRPPGFYDTAAWEERLRERVTEQNAGRSYYFLAFTAEAEEIIATCSLTGIVRGVFQACFMGYSVDNNHEGRGVMKTLCHHVIGYAFGDLDLHRIMANHMPGNIRSEMLLRTLGFEREGYARSYLKIHGRWEDHVLNALINPGHSN